MQEMNQIPERWYSTKEMCAYLGVTRDTLLTWINEKGIEPDVVVKLDDNKPNEDVQLERAFEELTKEH